MVFKSLGPVPHWRLLVDLFTPMLDRHERGEELISYEDCVARTGLSRTQLNSALPRARRELLDKHSRTIDVVRGIGYQLDRPERRVGMIKGFQKKGVNSFTQAENHATAVDQSRYTPEQFDQLMRQRDNQMVVNALVKRKLQQVDEQVGRIADRVQAVDDRVTNLTAYLERLGVTKHRDIVAGELADDEEDHLGEPRQG